MQWTKTTQKSVPLLSRYIATKFSLGKHISNTCLHDLKIKHYRYINNNNQVQAFFCKEELDKLYPLLWRAILSDKLEDFLNNYKDCGRDLVCFCRVLKNKNLSKATEEELKNLFRQWVDKYTKFIGHIYNGNFCVNIAKKKLLEKLEKEKEDNEFGVLTEPVQETDVKKRQNKIFRAIKKIREQNLEKLFGDIEKVPSEIVGELVDIHEQYRYLGSIFLTTNNYPFFEDFLTEIKHLLSLKERREEGDLQEQKNKIMGNLNLDEEAKIWIDKLITLGYYRTELLSYVQKAEYYSVGLFEEMARRLNISYKILVYLTDEEILDSLSVQKLVVPKEEIELRFNNYYVGLDEGKVNLSLPEKAAEEEKSVSEVRGTCASPGKVVGKVKIIRNSSEITKMGKGEVLVTFMTTPDYVIAMQKAAAIVTNDGGMTCHAAIISRELGVPCVVGTEKATRVLKDGDLVEVDADKGIVRIIKRAK